MQRIFSMACKNIPGQNIERFLRQIFQSGNLNKSKLDYNLSLIFSRGSDGKVAFHRLMLCASSDFLRQILEDNKNSWEIYLPDLTVIDLRLLYQIIYYGQIVGDCGVMKNALEIGTKLKLKYFRFFEAGKFTDLNCYC